MADSHVAPPEYYHDETVRALASLEGRIDTTGTRARARGWALWKALIVLAADIDKNPLSAATNQQVIAEDLNDPL